MGSERRLRSTRFRRALCGMLLAGLLPLLAAPRVYHSEQEALALAFPDADRIEAQRFPVDDTVRTRASAEAGVAVRDRRVVFYEARRGDEVLGHATVLAEKGKTLPFRFLVAIRPDGAVDQVMLLTYREPRGYEIEQRSFRAQYRDKRLSDPIRRGRDILNITGATISVDALSRGVRRALALYDVLVADVSKSQPLGSEARLRTEGARP